MELVAKQCHADDRPLVGYLYGYMDEGDLGSMLWVLLKTSLGRYSHSLIYDLYLNKGVHGITPSFGTSEVSRRGDNNLSSYSIVKQLIDTHVSAASYHWLQTHSINIKMKI